MTKQFCFTRLTSLPSPQRLLRVTSAKKKKYDTRTLNFRSSHCPLPPPPATSSVRSLKRGARTDSPKRLGKAITFLDYILIHLSVIPIKFTHYHTHSKWRSFYLAHRFLVPIFSLVFFLGRGERGRGIPDRPGSTAQSLISPYSGVIYFHTYLDYEQSIFQS